MSGSFEKSVKGGTKQKLAAPKSKYIAHILVATHAGDAGVAEIFRTLQNRLRDSTWTIVFKALIVTHLMIREGEPGVTLRFLAEQPSKLAISNFSDVQAQGRNIRHYHTYLLMRAKSFRDTRLDWVKEGQGRLKRLTVDKGLLRETECVQHQIQALLKCDLLGNEVENEITLTAFRLITMDLLTLFHIMNEGTINVLEHYFEMSKYDAERALTIYKTFSKQTTLVVEFLSTARHYENATRLEIPKLKHAPTSLTGSLEEYLHDPDFEINRRQYLAQQEAKKGRKVTSNGGVEPSKATSKPAPPKNEVDRSFPEPKFLQAAPNKPDAKGPAPDLIDFFDSIEQNQTTMATNPQQQYPNFQQNSYQQQQFQSQQPNLFSQPPEAQQQNPNAFQGNNPFGPPQQQQQATQPNFTGAGFGGYSHEQFTQGGQYQNGLPQFNPQQSFGQQQAQSTGYSQTSVNGFPKPQEPFGTGQQPQSTNPFRQSMFSQDTGTTTGSFPNNFSNTSTASQQSSNPFARDMTGQQSQSPFQSAPPNPGGPFSSQPNQSIPFASSTQGTPFSSPPPTQPLQPVRTGTNPFARTISPPQTQQSTLPLQPNPTGSTNPFRQSMFMNQQTGQGWQNSQGTMGGLEQLPTIPVFPRPGQQQQQQQQPSPWS